MVLVDRDAAVVVTLRPSAGRACGCRVGPEAWAHHDRLLRVVGDLDELLDLLELAVTWSELDWSGAGVVPPERWADLVENHRWDDPEKARRLFDLATDVALRGTPVPCAASPTVPTASPTHTAHPCLTSEAILAGEL